MADQKRNKNNNNTNNNHTNNNINTHTHTHTHIHTHHNNNNGAQAPTPAPTPTLTPSVQTQDTTVTLQTKPITTKKQRAVALIVRQFLCGIESVRNSNNNDVQSNMHSPASEQQTHSKNSSHVTVVDHNAVKLSLDHSDQKIPSSVHSLTSLSGALSGPVPVPMGILRLHNKHITSTTLSYILALLLNSITTTTTTHKHTTNNTNTHTNNTNTHTILSHNNKFKLPSYNTSACISFLTIPTHIQTLQQ